MKLINAEFKHFRILDDVEIDFNVSSTNIFFVNGLNGRGKTSFQDAMHWCLYDEAPEGGVANRQALTNNQGRPLSVEVAFEFQLENDEFEFVEIKRSANVVLEKGKQSKLDSHLSILGRQKGQSSFTVPVANVDQWLAKRFRAGLRQFFLFDGESLEKFFEKTTKEKIREAVREIAGVEAFEGIQTKLTELVNDWKKQLAKDSKGGTAISKEIDKQKHEQVARNAETDEYEADLTINRLQNELEEIDEYFRKFGNNSSVLQEEASLLLKIQTATQDLNQYRISQHNELLASGLEYAIDSKVIEDVMQEKAAAIAEGEYPPQFSEQLMLKILDQGVCVCGESISDGSPKHNFLKKQIEEHKELDSIGQDLISVCAYAEYWPTTATSKYQYFASQASTILQKNNEIRSLKAELEILQATLTGANKEEQNRNAERKRKIPFEISEAEIARTEAINQKEWALGVCRKLEKEIDKLKISSTQNDLIEEMVTKTEMLRSVAQRAHKAAVDSVRTSLEKAVDEEFGVIKAGIFKTVITDDFDVKTVTKEGDSVKLSSGENMMKAYVFAFALRKVIGFQFPLVVDTPFGRLDSENRSRLVDMITRLNAQKTLEEGNQVIFLMHDMEYTPEIKEIFNSTKPVEQYLSYQIDSEVSQIHEGIDPAWLNSATWKGWSNK